MHYRLKSLSLATLVLSLSLPVGVAESQTRENVQTTLTAQAQTTQERRDEALRLNELGVQQFNKGQFREALKNFEQALAIAKQIGDKQVKAQLSTILGQFTAIWDSCQGFRVLSASFSDRQTNW